MCHSCGSRNPDNMASYFLDCRFRGSDTPHPASLRSAGLSTAGGEARCFIRLKCYKILIAMLAGDLWALGGWSLLGMGIRTFTKGRSDGFASDSSCDCER